MSQNLPPILQNVIDGLVMGQQTLAMRSPGMEPPRPMGCPNCAQAEAEVDRLTAALNLEAQARVAAAEAASAARDDRDRLLLALDNLLPLLEGAETIRVSEVLATLEPIRDLLAYYAVGAERLSA